MRKKIANYLSMTIMIEDKSGLVGLKLHEEIRLALHCGKSLPIMQSISDGTLFLG
jgi:hypothetical protein